MSVGATKLSRKSFRFRLKRASEYSFYLVRGGEVEKTFTGSYERFIRMNTRQHPNTRRVK